MASFEQDTNRKWSVRFRYIEFGKYKNKRLRGFETKKDAQKAYNDFIATHPLSEKKSNYSEMLFKHLYQNYLEYKKPNIKISTEYDLKHNFEKHLLPIFANMKIYCITKRDIYSWQMMIEKKEFSYSFKSKLRDYLNDIFKYAVFYYDLPINPVSQVEPFKKKEQKKEMDVWSEEDFRKFLANVQNFEHRVFFLFLYLTGCRKGEAYALSWDRIDFKKQMVTINKNLTRKVENLVYAIVPTKTYNTRSILIPKNLITELKILKDQQQEYKESNFVFGGTYPLSDNTITRDFYRSINRAGVKLIHLHGLRHSHASLLISQGQSIVMVSKRLGHSSIEQTLNTYSHLMPNEEEKLIKKLNFTI